MPRTQRLIINDEKAVYNAYNVVTPPLRSSI